MHRPGASEVVTEWPESLIRFVNVRRVNSFFSEFGLMNSGVESQLR